jgi:hypothetical protein
VQGPAVRNFAQLLQHLRESIQPDWDLDQRVRYLVSYGGRYPVDQGLLSLSSLQKAALELLGTRSDFSAAQPPLGLTLGMKTYGRLAFGPFASADEGDLGLGWLAMTEAEAAALRAAQSRHRAVFEESLAQADFFWGALPRTELDRILDRVRESLDHVDPVLIYVEDRTYTLFGGHNNLLAERKTGRDHLFEAIQDRPPADWRPEDRVFLFGLHLLREAGLRAEEFCGRQLLMSSLDALLKERLEGFRGALKSSEPLPEDLQAKATLHRAWKQEMRGSHVICRRVHGLNFNKQEDFFPKDQVPDVSQEAKKALEPLFQESGVDWKPNAGLEAVRLWVSKVVSQPATDPCGHPLEQAIHRLVETATQSLNSDIGMSRSLRDFGQWAGVIDRQAADEACAWPTTEYFCCVVPSPDLKEALAGKGPLLATILNSISQRMDYNSWHYVPSHFDPAQVPQGRHFYYAPAMPDTAEWSSLHHAGHVLSTVLYSIRSPGPLTCRGREFPGFYDLRVMRQSGQPYSRDELKKAVAFSRVLGLFYQALMDEVSAGRASFRVQGFHKAWYQERYEPGRQERAKAT